MRRTSARLLGCGLALLLVGSVGCGPMVPREALQLRPDSLARRERESRRFETSDELQLLQAGAQVLQDLGFNLEESEVKLGVLVGSKSRDATDAGQIVGAIVVGAILHTEVPVDSVQHIRAAFITRPLADSRGRVRDVIARVTFQRTVYNTEHQVARTESLDDPELYQEFFSKLSKAVFLQAHDL